MYQRYLFPLLVILGLSGCTDSDIQMVKESRLQGYPSHTIGEAFDQRDLCSSTDWARKEDRGRWQVAYMCEIKGVEDFFRWRLEDAISSDSNYSQHQKDVDYFKRLLRSSEERLAELQQKGSDEEDRERIKNLKESIESNRQRVNDRKAKIEEFRSNIKDPEGNLPYNRAVEMIIFAQTGENDFKVLGGSLLLENDEGDSELFKYRSASRTLDAIYDNRDSSFRTYARRVPVRVGRELHRMISLRDFKKDDAE